MASHARIITHFRLASAFFVDVLRLSLVVVQESELDSDSDSAWCSDPSKLRVVASLLS